MIQYGDILTLCNRFQDVMHRRYLKILRERYNGEAFMNCRMVGEKLGLSGDRVRTLEQKGLRMLAKYQIIERTEEMLYPTRIALSLWEPWATL